MLASVDLILLASGDLPNDQEIHRMVDSQKLDESLLHKQISNPQTGGKIVPDLNWIIQYIANLTRAVQTLTTVSD
jgi:hypothetical protein